MTRDDDRLMAERQRRLDALHALAGQQERQPSASQASHPAAAQRPAAPVARADARVVHSPRRRESHAPRPAWQIIGAGVLAIAVVVAVALVAIRALDQRPTAPLAPDPLVVPVSRAGMGCLTNARWSPDGKRIAALMTPNACNRSGADGGGTSLVLYDAALTRPGTPIALDHAILLKGLPPSVQQDPTLMQQAGVAFYTMQWSPDSTQIAVLAGGPVPSAATGISVQSDYFWALALVNAQSGAVRVIATPPQSTAAFSGDNSAYNPDSYRPALAWRFDLTAGTSTFASIPQALAYTWGADGSLTPSVPMPAQGSAPVAFIGAGSPWQSFSISQVPGACATAYEIMLTASLWSPDGRYVVPMLYAHGLLANAPAAVPTPTPQDGGDGTNPCSSPSTPPSTASLAPLVAPGAAASAISELASAGSSYSVGVQGLLSPNGHRLAVAPFGMPYMPWIAQIYDAASGKLHGTITQQVLGTTYSAKGSVSIAWSPDGSHLLLWDNLAFYLLGARSLGG